jgi:hypothetical protein
VAGNVLCPVKMAFQKLCKEVLVPQAGGMAVSGILLHFNGKHLGKHINEF